MRATIEEEEKFSKKGPMRLGEGLHLVAAQPISIADTSPRRKQKKVLTWRTLASELTPGNLRRTLSQWAQGLPSVSSLHPGQLDPNRWKHLKITPKHLRILLERVARAAGALWGWATSRPQSAAEPAPSLAPRRRRGSSPLPRAAASWRLLPSQQCLMGLFLLILLSTFGTTLLMTLPEEEGSFQRSLRSYSIRRRVISRIAFGSETSPHYRPQPVWSQGVIPSKPDAWIWLGNMAYLDMPSVDCEATPRHPQCNCTSDWLHQAPFGCMTGNLEHARGRMQSQLSNPDYAQFLEHMCPGHRAKQMQPPPGSSPSVCPRPILGTYGDRDYGWQGGNARMPSKDAAKGVFLDAFGEPPDSARRRPGIGIFHKHTLNKGRKGREIDVILLDDRYHRDPLPCQLRRHFCEARALNDTSHALHAWCRDFLQGGAREQGSCCVKDERLFFGWCAKEENQKYLLRREACDPTSPKFGHLGLLVDSMGELRKPDPSIDGPRASISPVCEVLGREQRTWLEGQLSQSQAALIVVVSASPLFSNPVAKVCPGEEGRARPLMCECDGNEWECYKPAQLQLLHLLSRAPACVLVLSGGPPLSDIKMVSPGEHAYSHYYRSRQLSRSVYQMTASGLTESAGAGLNYTCHPSKSGRGWTDDPLGTRLASSSSSSSSNSSSPECSYVGAPSFGMLQVEWRKGESGAVRLQVRDGNSGDVRLETVVDLHTCGAGG